MASLSCDSGQPLETTPSCPNLCEACSRALIIDDQLIGGALKTTKSGSGVPSLEFLGLSYKPWSLRCAVEFWNVYQRASKKKGAVKRAYSDPSLSRLSAEYPLREYHAGGDDGRWVTPPEMPELSGPASKECPFCARLRLLFHTEYGKTSWWNNPKSVFHFYIKYEWAERRDAVPREEGEETCHSDQEEKAKRKRAPRATVTHELKCLAVVIDQVPEDDQDTAHSYNFDVGAWPGDCRDWLKIVNSPRDPRGPASEANIRFMKQCIRNCAENHERCRDEVQKAPYVPTRLLDIGDGMASHAILVNRDQVLATSLNTRIEYATLSYCWGGVVPVTTTEATKAMHETIGIKLDDMPKAFQDAIHVVGRLGIRYLWIDALCIIQGSKEDWEAESVRMCDIFAKSHVTLSAAVSSRCTEGFLHRRANGDLTLPFRSSLRPEISGEYTIIMEGRNVSRANFDIRQSRWRQRAWTWQEEVMSRRQLVFGDKMLQFRCKEGAYMEHGPHESASIHFNLESSSLWSVTGWIAREYSRRELTFARDKLAAISGVARFIHDADEALGEPTSYLAGLWLDDSLGLQMHWRCLEPEPSYNAMLQSLEDESEYCAPSWSWASRRTGVDYTFEKLVLACHVIGYDLKPANSDAMVRVKFGSSITLRGRCRQTPVIPCDTRHQQAIYPVWGRTLTVTSYGHLAFVLDWTPRENDPKEVEIQKQLHLFPTSTRLGADEKVVWGLLLLPFGGPQERVYRRVGLFQHFDGNRDWLTNEPESNVTII